MVIAGRRGFVNLPTTNQDDRDEAIDDALADHPDNGDLIAGVVTSVNAKQVVVTFVNADPATITGDGLRFPAAGLRSNASAAVRLKPGSIVRVVQDAKGNWSITQLPQVEGALVSLVPQDGAIRALIGGFDYNKNKFNHVTQAWRQPGRVSSRSSIRRRWKGLGPATIINDAPLYFPPTTPGGDAWEPKDDDQPDGPMSMRTALQKSKNLVFDPYPFLHRHEVRAGLRHAEVRFRCRQDAAVPAACAGRRSCHPAATGRWIFGVRQRRLADQSVPDWRSADAHGTVISRANPLIAGSNAPQTLEPRNAYVMNSLLHSVATGGTGAGTNVLKRNDLQGKTGTTNDAKDGWFAGYQHQLVAVAWMGWTSRSRSAAESLAHSLRCRSGWSSCNGRLPRSRSSKWRCPMV